MSRRKILIPVIIFTILIIILIIALNPSHKYNSLSINVSKWDNIKESRIENKNLKLEDIRFNDYKLIIDEQNDTIYYSIVNESKNKYNPNVSYEVNNKNAKLVILSDEKSLEEVKSNYEFKVMIYNEKEYHIYGLKCTDLPILNISYNEDEEIKQKNIPMEMYLFDNLSNIPNKITISSGKVKQEEDNYIFSLHMLTPGKNKRDNKISILNMRPNSAYILSKVNNTSDGLQEQETENKRNRVELFLNDEYQGVYYINYIENQLKKNTPEQNHTFE